jgi:predicted HAD superfamily Cof-like phosphohydrolase
MITQLDMYDYWTSEDPEECMPKTTREQLVKEFHEAFGHKVAPAEITTKDLELRQRLLKEEFSEVLECMWELNALGLDNKSWRLGLLKEICDLQYVLSGLAVELGFDIEKAFRRVHKSNMSKLDDNGKPVYREDGKVLKSKNYKAPNLEDLI